MSNPTPPTPNPGAGAGDPSADPVELLQSVYSHYIIIGCSVAGIVWGAINAHWVSFVARMALPGQVNSLMQCSLTRATPCSIGW